MRLVMQSVGDPGDPSDDPVFPHGQEVLRRGVLEKGVLLRGEERRDVPTQRRDPERVPRVQSIGKIDEAPEVAPRPDGASRHRAGQMTPSSRPRRPMVSRQ